MRLQKSKKAYFTMALVSSILFVVGIPMIVLGAVNKIWVVMAFGIAFTAIDFYAMPLLWVGYGNRCGYTRIVEAIVRQHISDVSVLAQQLGRPYKDTYHQVQVCMAKGYLEDYILDGNTIKANNYTPIVAQQITEKCVNCGATFAYNPKNPTTCPYCSTPVKK